MRFFRVCSGFRESKLPNKLVLINYTQFTPMSITKIKKLFRINTYQKLCIKIIKKCTCKSGKFILSFYLIISSFFVQLGLKSPFMVMTCFSLLTSMKKAELLHSANFEYCLFSFLNSSTNKENHLDCLKRIIL